MFANSNETIMFLNVINHVCLILGVVLLLALIPSMLLRTDKAIGNAQTVAAIVH